MKARSFQLLILAWSVPAWAGCHSDHPASSSHPLAVAEPCSPVPRQTPVFYDDTGTPSKRTPAFSELELARVTDRVATQTKDPIWFIRVKPSHPGGYRTATVYLVPQTQTQRVREGRAYNIGVDGQEVTVHSSTEYIQISKQGQTFTRQLILPAVSDLPFSRPDLLDPDSEKGAPISEEELIRIVDFIRQPSTYRGALGHRMSPEKMAEEVQRMPILKVTRWRDNISVDFGYQHAPLFGYGVGVTIKPTSTGYGVVGWGEWLS